MTERDQTTNSGEESLGQTLHDLRTPLNQIIGLSEMLIEIAEEEGHRDLQDGLGVVRLAGLELAALLQDGQILSSNPSPESGSLSLNGMARGPLSRVIGYADLALEEPLEERLESYRADLLNIRQAGRRFLTLARESGLYVALRTELPPETATPLADSAAVISPALAGARVLVVDDESLNREVLCRRLEREGCRPTGVDSGREALALLSRDGFDALLLDMLMPEMSGLQVLQALKADERLRFLPVIMLSAHTEVDRVARCLELGAEDYLPKPINAVLLRARLGACLEKKKMAEELLRAGKLQSVGLLAGGLAHDFNNMLTTVLGNLSLLRFGKELSARARESLDAAERGAIRAQELTRYLLTFAEGGAPAKERLQPHILLEEILRKAVPAGDRRVELLVTEKLWPVEADPHQLTQVLSNLLANAVEATEPGGTIVVSAGNVPGPLPALDLPGESYLRVAVGDRGCGIPAEVLPRVFDPFFTTKPGSRGLGLALAYSVVQRHGGHLALSSEAGEGTAATFYLPAFAQTLEVAAPAGDRAPLNLPPAAVPAGSQPRRVRVLVMDDEPDIRGLMDTMLTLLGYDVVTTQNGEEALAAHEQAVREKHPFDITIMDLTIPNGMGGAETIKRLREKDKGIRAVVASGYSDDPVIARHRQYGFDSVLPKPYVINDLIRILEALSEPLTH